MVLDSGFRTKRVGWTAALLVLLSAGSLVAHHSLARFDTTKPVWIKGVIVVFQYVNPHSFIFVDEKRADGKIERWAVEGPGVFRLNRLGITRDTFQPGDEIEACGYLFKEGVGALRTIDSEPGSTSLNAQTPKISGRVLAAEQLVMPDGNSRPWEDYGAHHCLGPDHRDFHTR